jgi:hypothetical protein
MDASGARDLLLITPFSFKRSVCVAMQQLVYDVSTEQRTRPFA